MAFRKYDHLERFGHDEVDGISVGEVYVFAKLDGTNASVWFENGEVQCGSRNRKLSEESDNQGFWAWVHSPENKVKVESLLAHGAENWNIYGEWLVPHSLKTYREEAWRRFYVFDVYDRTTEKYLHYEDYAEVIRGAGLDLIEPLCKYTNPSDEQLHREAENNTYLIMDNAGAGEGVVLKTYSWRNNFGRQPWAKIVRNEFKEENRREFGTTEKGGLFQVEAAIAEKYVTQALVEKTRAKIENQIIQETKIDIEDRTIALTRSRSKIIPQLLGMVFYELVNEEIWSALKDHKFPTVDFKKLRQHSIHWTKKYAADLF